MTAPGWAEEAEKAVIVCPQCEGEGGYPDGLDEAACHTDCTRCAGNGWIADITELSRLCVSREEYERVCKALEPFALMLDEGVIKPRPGSATYATVTTCIEYFNRASAALKDQSHDQ